MECNNEIAQQHVIRCVVFKVCRLAQSTSLEPFLSGYGVDNVLYLIV